MGNGSSFEVAGNKGDDANSSADRVLPKVTANGKFIMNNCGAVYSISALSMIDIMGNGGLLIAMINGNQSFHTSPMTRDEREEFFTALSLSKEEINLIERRANV